MDRTIKSISLPCHLLFCQPPVDLNTPAPALSGSPFSNSLHLCLHLSLSRPVSSSCSFLLSVPPLFHFSHLLYLLSVRKEKHIRNTAHSSCLGAEAQGRAPSLGRTAEREREKEKEKERSGVTARSVLKSNYKGGRG